MNEKPQIWFNKRQRQTEKSSSLIEKNWELQQSSNFLWVCWCIKTESLVLTQGTESRPVLDNLRGLDGKKPERRSEAMQFETFLKKPVGRISSQKENFRCCMISSKFLWLIGKNCVMVFELISSGHGDNTYPVADIQALTACQFFWIYSYISLDDAIVMSSVISAWASTTHL